MFNHKIAIGLDIGMEETSAFYLKRATANVSPQPLYISNLREVTIPSIMYSNGQGVLSLIGSTDDHLIYDFKKSPIDWLHQYQKHGITKTFKEIMSAFIKAVWNSIRTNNSEIFEGVSENEILIVVGCPASKDWSDAPQRKRYRQLIKTALGLHDVYVIPEGVAAAFRYAAYTSEGSVKLKSNIAVFDFDSSSVSFTCIENGTASEESYRRWTLGMRSIYRNVYTCNRQCDGTADKQTEHMLLETKKSLSDIDSDRIRHAFEKMPVYAPVWENGDPQSEGSLILEKIEEENGDNLSWKEYCYLIFKYIKAQLQNKALDRIVLIGDANRIYFIKELCAEVFPDICIDHDEKSHCCVSYGLCRIADNLTLIQVLFRQAMVEVESDDLNDFNRSQTTVKLNIMNYLADKRDKFIGSHPVETKFGQLISDANQYMNKSVSKSEIEKHIKELNRSLKARYEKFAAECSRRLYGSEAFIEGCIDFLYSGILGYIKNDNNADTETTKYFTDSAADYSFFSSLKSIFVSDKIPYDRIVRPEILLKIPEYTLMERLCDASYASYIHDVDYTNLKNAVIRRDLKSLLSKIALIDIDEDIFSEFSCKRLKADSGDDVMDRIWLNL